MWRSTISGAVKFTKLADQAVGRELEVLQLDGQVEAVDQTEDQGRRLGRMADREQGQLGLMSFIR